MTDFLKIAQIIDCENGTTFSLSYCIFLFALFEKFKPNICFLKFISSVNTHGNNRRILEVV